MRILVARDKAYAAWPALTTARRARGVTARGHACSPTPKKKCRRVIATDRAFANVRNLPKNLRLDICRLNGVHPKICIPGRTATLT
jgi:hypothetical protein